MGYSKAETIKKQKQLVSKAQRNKRKALVSAFKIFLCLIIAGIFAGAGAAFGMLKGIIDNAPSIDDINIVPKGYKTCIYDQNGNLTMEVSTIGSNREYVYYDEIPEMLVNAFVAIEDERYWSHNGIDIKGIFRAAYEGVSTGDFDQGASTITQQLIKNNVFNVGMGERTFLDKLDRKIQEQYLAIELEKKYSKEEIVEYYLNTIYLGRGTNGVQAASEKYFGKPMDELTISEMAVIAGITQNPSKYDPTRFPEYNEERRDMVLNKMLELEYITEAQYDEAKADDVYTRIAEHKEYLDENATYNTYFEDAILDQLEADFMDIYGCTKEEAQVMIYTGGYSVYSTQDMQLQEICDTYINDTSYYKENTSVSLEYQLTLVVDGEFVNYSTGHLVKYFKDKTGNKKYNTIYKTEDLARAAADEFKEYKLNETGGKFYADKLNTAPQPQFSFVLMDHHTGFVKAMVGGRGEKKANRGFNRATDAKRQPGSCFKVLAVFVPFIDAYGGGLAYPTLDEPYAYENGVFVKQWWGNSYRGYVGIREAIAWSMNIVAVKTITKITPRAGFDYLQKMGITTLVEKRTDAEGNVLSDINQSLALGGITDGVTNFEITAAYASIANEGIRMKPTCYSKVLDHDGNVVIDYTNQEGERVMRASTAFQIMEGLKAVVTSGSGTIAKMRSGMVNGGKTGTTSSTYDVWFVGSTPYYTAGIWMGYDSNVNMGSVSSHKALWRDIMDKIVEVEGQDITRTFMDPPDGMVKTSLCVVTGLHPIAGCETVTDWYYKDDIPKGTCPGHVMVEFCTETKMQATNTCPATEKFALTVDEEGKTQLLNALPGYKYTTDICTLHPAAPDKYMIKTSSNEGGTISGSIEVDKGSAVTVYITPNPGAAIVDVTVNGVSVGAVTSYTISDVQSDISVVATFSGGAPAPAPDPAPTPEPEP